MPTIKRIRVITRQSGLACYKVRHNLIQTNYTNEESREVR